MNGCSKNVTQHGKSTEQTKVSDAQFSLVLHFEELYSHPHPHHFDISSLVCYTIDPSLGWYKGELWFFDNYIIPLAKKLKDCGAFGAASDECLNYALANRKEWAAKGEEIVKRFVAKHTK